MPDIFDKTFNKKKQDIEKIIDIDKKYDFVFDDYDIGIVEIFLNDKPIIKCEYQVMGIYNMALSIWYWGWGISFVNKDLIKDVEKIKNTDLNKKIKNNEELEQFHYLIANNNFYIQSKNINVIIKLILNICDGLWVFPAVHKDNVEYILITKILQIT